MAQSPARWRSKMFSLALDIARQVAVAVDVVGRDVQPDRDVGTEGLEQLELVRRGQLQHVEAVGSQRGEVDDAAADVAADLVAHAGLLEDMAGISAVVVDLPLVPVIATKRASGWARASSSTSQEDYVKAARAATATGCGLGRVLGMPGLITSAVTGAQSIDSGSATRARPRRRHR